MITYFQIDKHLAGTKHFTPMKMLTDLTYLPDLTIYEKLDKKMKMWDL